MHSSIYKTFFIDREIEIIYYYIFESYLLFLVTTVHHNAV